MTSGPSFPGGNLPEHHFKKRYFNVEYQRQQKETERHLDQQRRQEHYERSQGRLQDLQGLGRAGPEWPDRPGYHHGEPRPGGGGGYHLALRQLHPDHYRHLGRYQVTVHCTLYTVHCTLYTVHRETNECPTFQVRLRACSSEAPRITLSSRLN